MQSAPREPNSPPPGRATRHRFVREWVLREIQSYALSARLPSDRELAKRLNVAPLTVKRAMGDLEREGYVARRQGKGTFLVTREKPVRVRSADAPPNGVVLFAYPDYFSYEYWRRANAAEEIALKGGLGLVEFKMHPLTTYRNLLDAAASRKDVRGVMVDPVPGTVTRKVFRALDGLGVPVVLFAASEYVTLGERVHSFVPDWFKMGYLGARHLIERGHRAIGLVNNEPPGQDRGLHAKGVRQALGEAGLGARSLVRVRGGTKAWASSMQAGYELTGRLVRSHDVTAVMLDSVHGAFGALRAVWERRMRVPDDLSLLANGEWNRQEEFSGPPITTARFDVREQVRTAFEVMLGERTPTSKTFLADVTVTERESVAAPRSPGAAGTGVRAGSSRKGARR